MSPSPIVSGRGTPNRTKWHTEQHCGDVVNRLAIYKRARSEMASNSHKVLKRVCFDLETLKETIVQGSTEHNCRTPLGKSPSTHVSLTVDRRALAQ
jgi:hypothetical protein